MHNDALDVSDRFVNTRGGPGRNIPCDLYNEHIVRLIKDVISSMGANLTEKALQRAARSMNTLYSVCKQVWMNWNPGLI